MMRAFVIYFVVGDSEKERSRIEGKRKRKSQHTGEDRRFKKLNQLVNLKKEVDGHLELGEAGEDLARVLVGLAQQTQAQQRRGAVCPAPVQHTKHFSARGMIKRE